MTIVVKKVPKFLRGFVKFIFGIKNLILLKTEQNETIFHFALF